MKKDFFNDKEIHNRPFIPWDHPHKLKIIQSNWPAFIEFMCWTGEGGERGDCDTEAVAVFRLKNYK